MSYRLNLCHRYQTNSFQIYHWFLHKLFAFDQKRKLWVGYFYHKHLYYHKVYHENVLFDENKTYQISNIDSRVFVGRTTNKSSFLSMVESNLLGNIPSENKQTLWFKALLIAYPDVHYSSLYTRRAYSYIPIDASRHRYRPSKWAVLGVFPNNKSRTAFSFSDKHCMQNFTSLF